MVCLLQRCEKQLALISSCVFINNIPGWVFPPSLCLLAFPASSSTRSVPLSHLLLSFPSSVLRWHLGHGSRGGLRTVHVSAQHIQNPGVLPDSGSMGVLKGATAPPRAHVLREAPARPPEPFVALSSVGRGRGSRAF